MPAPVIVIADAGPIIFFARVERLDILQERFATVWVVSTVLRELTDLGFPDAPLIAQALDEGWLEEKEAVSNEGLDIARREGLHAGERDSFALAWGYRRLGADVTVLLDDGPAYEALGREDIARVTTPEVLLWAREQRLFKGSPAKMLRRMRYRAAPQVRQTLEKAGLWEKLAGGTGD
jgi:predicted nucleic acid-binding protein